MSFESLVLAENISNQTDTVVYSLPKKGSGFHREDGLHLYIYQVEHFIGNITLQATLKQYPGNNDWFDINETVFNGDGSTVSQSNNFLGNFVWIRAAYQLSNGVIRQIRFNF